MNILQEIFTDYYEEIKYTLHPRKTEMENIDKMLGCGDPSLGGAMKPNIEELRKKYMDNPPEGMTSKDIRSMSEDKLLDMDYFLNEDDLFADEAGVEGFYIF